MTSGIYVRYLEQNRHCIPYLNCPPGYEIIPCSIEFKEDMCIKCHDGFVQPELISSTGYTNTTKCFKPLQNCLASDVTYSRTKTEAFCSDYHGCKCNTQDCYFGDPCVCDSREKCGTGHYMNDTGHCVPCPEGTEKNETGCGPCKRLRFDIQVHPAATHTSSHKSIFSTEGSPSTEAVSAPGKWRIQENEDNTLLIVVGILGLVLLVLVIIIVILVSRRTARRRAGVFMFSGICWTGNRQEDRIGVQGNQQIQMEVEPLVRNQDPNVQQPDGVKTEKENVVTYPVSDSPDSSSNIPGPRDSVSSGIGESDLDNSSQNSQEDIDGHKKPSKNKVSVDEGTSDIHCDTSEQNIDQKNSLPHLNVTASLVQDYNWSESRSPVTAESEPPMFRTIRSDDVLRPDSVEGSCSQRDTSGYETTDTTTGMASGSYISMNVSDPVRYETEELTSALENFTFNVKGSNNEIECVDHQKDINHSTRLKHSGPSSFSSYGGELDSGIQIE